MSMPSLFYIGSYEMIVVQVLLLAGVIGAITAKAKGRSGLIWFVLSVAQLRRRHIGRAVHAGKKA